MLATPNVKVKFFFYDGSDTEKLINEFLKDKLFVFATENRDGANIYYKECGD